MAVATRYFTVVTNSKVEGMQRHFDCILGEAHTRRARGAPAGRWTVATLQEWNKRIRDSSEGDLMAWNIL